MEVGTMVLVGSMILDGMSVAYKLVKGGEGGKEVAGICNNTVPNNVNKICVVVDDNQLYYADTDSLDIDSVVSDYAKFGWVKVVEIENPNNKKLIPISRVKEFALSSRQEEAWHVNITKGIKNKEVIPRELILANSNVW